MCHVNILFCLGLSTPFFVHGKFYSSIQKSASEAFIILKSILVHSIVFNNNLCSPAHGCIQKNFEEWVAGSFCSYIDGIYFKDNSLNLKRAEPPPMATSTQWPPFYNSLLIPRWPLESSSIILRYNVSLKIRPCFFQL